MERKSLKSNIWKYAILLVAQKRIFAAILGAYYLTIPDSTAQTIGIILLAGNVAGFIFEIPSGYLSDKVGHKEALVLSRIFAILSTLAFLFANSVALLIIGSILLSLSFSFMSGTGDAFMHETLKCLKKDHDYTKIMGKLSSVGFAVPIVFMVCTPFLVTINFKAPFVAGLFFDLVGIIISLMLVKPSTTQEQIKEINTQNFRAVMREGLRLRFFRFAIFASIIAGLLFSVSAFRPAYQYVLGIPVIYYGILFGVGRVLASLLLAYSGKIKERLTIYSFYKLQIALYIPLIFLLAITASPPIVVTVFIIMNAGQWGLSQISTGFMLDIIKTSNFKATLLSTKSQATQMTTAITGVVLGVMIDKTSYQLAFLYMGIFFAIVLPIYLFILNRINATEYNN